VVEKTKETTDMNHTFDKLAKGLAQSVTRCRALKEFSLGRGHLALAGLLALPTVARAATLGPLIELSRPNAVGACDSGFVSLPGTWTLDDALEPVVVVNPTNPRNIVAAWIQGLFQNIVAAVSFNGGRTWQQVPIPLTTCSGGPFLGCGDPWLSFAPNGDLHAVALVGNTLDNRYVGATKSTDGGLHWTAPVLVSDISTDPVPDHPSITADPLDARFAYAIWDTSAGGTGNPSGAFSRTTNGGQTWEPPRVLARLQPQQTVQFSQIFILPDGTLVNLFETFDGQSIKKPNHFRMMRSADRGLTWSAPVPVLATTPVYTKDSAILVIDPDTGQFVTDALNPSFAIDRRSGNLYAVWEDGRFSSFQYHDIAFSMSADGGVTWSSPIRVNQTPLNIPVLNRQSFLPIIAVADDGTIGVSYYDFRFNDPSPGVPTDYWLVHCQPSLTRPATDPANWGNEIRLTDTSFNLESCGIVGANFRLGEYFGLATAGSDFISAFTQVDQNNVTAIFFRRSSN
jgi:hypothetical protein